MRLLLSRVLLLCAMVGGSIKATGHYQLMAQPLLYSVLGHQTIADASGSDGAHPFSVSINPASIALRRELGWAFGGEQRFLAPGWTEVAAALILPATGGAWGLFLGQEGLPNAVDQVLKVTHARIFSTQGCVGASVGIARKKVGPFTSVISPAVAVGLSFSLSSELYAGISFDHLSRRKLENLAANDLSVLRLMLAYRPTKKIAIVSGVSKENGHASNRSISFYYAPQGKAAFRVGYAAAPTLWWVGMLVGVGSKVAVQLHTGVYSLSGVSNGMSIFNMRPAIKSDVP